MVPHKVNADIEVRNRVPHGSASHFGHAPIGIAIRHVGETAAKRSSVYLSARTPHLLRSTIVFHAKHAAIDRRSPFRIPPMLVGGVEGPYSGEFYIAA